MGMILTIVHTYGHKVAKLLYAKANFSEAERGELWINNLDLDSNILVQLNAKRALCHTCMTCSKSLSIPWPHPSRCRILLE